MPADNTSDTVPQVNNVEIDQESQRAATQLEMRDQLGLMDGQERIHGLELRDDPVFDQEVDSVAHVQTNTLKLNRNRQLTGYLKPLVREHMGDARLIGALQKPWTQRSVDAKRGIQKLRRNLLDTDLLGHAKGLPSQAGNVHEKRSQIRVTGVGGEPLRTRRTRRGEEDLNSLLFRRRVSN